jgi:class 3 adenylate cyclase/tetratricopeptide (TPR) repeat protein
MATAPVTLLFTDLAHSTELLHRVGDERAQRILRAHRQVLQDAIASHGGGEVKWLGDGLMTVFTSVADAVRCAIAMQQQARRPAAGERLGLRIGLHVGEALPDEGDYVGTPVVLARRLCERATARQILCSGLVVDLLRGRQAFRFADVGALALKGFPDPVRAYEVAYEPEDAAARLGQTPFTGRTAELARLMHRLEDARGARGGVVLVMGEPGIGKTRTLEEFAERVRAQGTLVLWGRCYEGEAGRPYGPFAEAIAEYARTAAAEALEADLGPGAAPLGRLVPGVRARLRDLPEPVPLEPYEERVRLLDAVTQFLLALAARVPTVLVLDDLHWADAGTVALLRHVARFAPRGRLLVLGAYRDVEVDRQHPLAEALGTLPRETRYEHVGLAGLDRPAVQALLDAIGEAEVEPGLVEAVAHETSGNPFFIREVLLHLLEEGALARDGRKWRTALPAGARAVPETVRQVIERRLGRVSAAATQLLRVAAAFTAGVPFEVARRVAGLEEAGALDALDEALGAQLLAPTADPDRFDFAHALVRHALYDAQSPPRQVRLHRQIAEMMAQVYGERASEHAAEIARHWHRSASLPAAERGVPFCLVAAEQAGRSTAFADAAAHLRAALELLPASAPQYPRIQASLGLVLVWALRFDEASEVACVAAARVAEAESPPAAADYLAEIVKAFNEVGAPSMIPPVALVRRGLEYAGDRRDAAWAVLRAADILARESGDPGLAGLRLDTPERRELAAVMEHVQLPRELAWEFATFSSRAEIVAREADAARHYSVGDLRGGLILLREEAEHVERLGRIGRAIGVWSEIALFEIALGEFAEAQEARRKSVAFAKRLAAPSVQTYWLLIAEDFWRVARDDEWDRVAGSLGPGFGEAGNLMFQRATAKTEFGRACARMGFFEPALEHLSSALPAIERAPASPTCTVMAWDAAEILWLSQRTDWVEIIKRNVREKVIAPDFRFPMMDGRLALARLCALQQRYEEAADWFAKARTVLDEQGARPLRAIVDYDEALMYTRRDIPGDRERAAPLLDAALAQFRTLDMPGWIRRAETL